MQCIVLEVSENNGELFSYEWPLCRYKFTGSYDE